MALYKFDKFKAEKAEKSPDLTIVVSKSKKISQPIKTSDIIADGAYLQKVLQIYHLTNVYLLH
jgi:leucyl aminopeptidase